MLCWLAAIVITGLLLWSFYWVAIKSGEKALAEDAAHAKKLSDQRKLKRVKEQDPLNKEKPLISLVLLLKERQYVDDQVLRSAAKKAWGVEIPQNDPDALDWVISAGPPGHFLMKVGDITFMILNMNGPYFDNAEENAEKANELWTRKILLQNKAWLAFDWLQAASETRDKDHVYRLIAKLLAQFADDNCLAIYHPESRRFTPYDEDLLAKLTQGDPVETLAKNTAPPVISIENDDALMQAAVQQAQMRWPEFVAAFESHPSPFNGFVKAPFSDGSQTEFMWFQVTAIEGDQILGVLNNQPVNLTRFKLGQRVRINFDQLNDWLFIDTQKNKQGGFTIDVVDKRQQESRDE